jgi:hypothetical protein
LLADDDQPIRDEPRQQPFDRKKQSRLTTPIIAMKNVAVIRVHKLALPWFAD